MPSLLAEMIAPCDAVVLPQPRSGIVGEKHVAALRGFVAAVAVWCHA